MFGMYQEGNPFALFETGIHYRYTRAKSMILSLCQILVFITQQSNRVKKSFPLDTIDPQPLPSSSHKIKGGHFSARAEWIIRSGKINVHVLEHDGTNRLIRSALFDCSSDQIRAKLVYYKPLTTLSLDQ